MNIGYCRYSRSVICSYSFESSHPVPSFNAFWPSNGVPAMPSFGNSTRSGTTLQLRAMRRKCPRALSLTGMLRGVPSAAATVRTAGYRVVLSGLRSLLIALKLAVRVNSRVSARWNSGRASASRRRALRASASGNGSAS